MAVPKRKMSRANTRARRAQWKARPAALTAVNAPDGELLVVPRRFAKAYARGLAVR
ncbi:50S ribosomal protein L32 [Rarobacter incanus]|uniref:Large ribosomal subunit protein bL32 n=1 Tax=Rarobacter incanus TaxID=153494 RepID=A0A542SQT8_9MICO|nr:50S ribosomal protein L32 [Rarobacter incanus]TQK76958.1 large subunit ribosomal protein L32 [Rarobacter incanus]